MKVLKYASMQVCTHICKYASMNICMYADKCKYVSMLIYASIQVWEYASMQVWQEQQCVKVIGQICFLNDHTCVVRF